MKSITNIAQLRPEDFETVVEVLQMRWLLGKNKKLIWERGVYLGRTTYRQRDDSAVLLTQRPSGDYWLNTVYSGERGEFPNLVDYESSGILAHATQSSIDRYGHLLNEIEPEREYLDVEGSVQVA